MKKTIISIICSLLICMLYACVEQDVSENFPASGELTITASIPVEQTRIGLSESDGTLDLITHWEDGERIQMFAKQGNRVFELEPSYAKNILKQGKQCSFTVHYGEELNIMQPFELYGLSGVDGYVKDGKALLAKSRLWRAVEWNMTKAPMWFHVTGGVQSTNSPIHVQFQHLGAYEVLHVKNASNDWITFRHGGFKVAVPWYKSYEETNLTNGSSQSSALQTDEVSWAPVYIGAGLTYDVLSWYIPSGSLMKDAKLCATINNRFFETVDTKSSAVSILPGHAYHMYVTWDGENLRFDEGSPVEVSKFEVTKANYYPNHFTHGGRSYSFRYYCTAYVKLNDDTNIQDWGYVYVDPDGNESELISLMPYKSDVGVLGDNRYSYYRDECVSTVKLKGYVRYRNDSQIHYGPEQEFQISYPDETSIAINSCTFQGTTNNVSYLGRTYKYKSTFRYIFSATGAYWMKVGTQVDGPGWSNWTDLPNQTISPVDGSKANALTVNYYYDDKTFTGDYYVFLIATDDTHARSSRTAEYVGYTYSANQFTGCILYGTQNSRLTPVCDIVEGGQSQDNEEPVSDYIINIVSNK